MNTMTAPRTITIGNVDPSSTLLESLTLPVLSDLGAAADLIEAIRHATNFRTGVLVSGPKGTGKSLGLAQAYRAFLRAEKLRAENDKRLGERKVVLFGALSAHTRGEMIRELYRRELGEVDWKTARRGDAGLLEELIGTWKEKNVCVVVFDEVENLPAAALDVCREILTTAAPAHEDRIDDQGRFRSDGIGVVLIGTPEVARRLMRTKEWGERWARHIEVPALPSDMLPAAYAAYLPALRAEQERRGAAAWAAFIREHIAPYHNGSLRRLQTHVHCYATLYADNAPTAPQSAEEIGFDEDLFLASMLEMAGVSLSGEAGSDALERAA
jgi:hypothetical protein